MPFGVWAKIICRIAKEQVFFTGLARDWCDFRTAALFWGKNSRVTLHRCETTALLQIVALITKTSSFFYSPTINSFMKLLFASSSTTYACILHWSSFSLRSFAAEALNSAWNSSHFHASFRIHLLPNYLGKHATSLSLSYLKVFSLIHSRKIRDLD